MLGLIGPVGAADLPNGHHAAPSPNGIACAPREDALLYWERGLFPTHLHPTVPGRTHHYTCVTGTVLKPGDVPPPPEYCCG